MKQVMHRNAVDSVYLHKDFHGVLSCGIEYLHEHYGEDAVREYLREFTLTFYAPLRQALREKGLAVLKDHFEAVYRQEGGEAQFELSDDELVIRVAACPAVQHLRAAGYHVARLFHETTRTVNEVLCEDTPYIAELIEYDPQTGRNIQRFRRRSANLNTTADRRKP